MCDTIAGLTAFCEKSLFSTNLIFTTTHFQGMSQTNHYKIINYSTTRE